MGDGTMPELPEVETTRVGIMPHVTGRVINQLLVREHRLRWPVDPHLSQWASGQRITGVSRRAKYLLLELEQGWLMLHLGMSGSLRVLPQGTAPLKHDHVDILLDSGRCFDIETQGGSDHSFISQLSATLCSTSLAQNRSRMNFRWIT